jgi:hypothetical protein
LIMRNFQFYSKKRCKDGAIVYNTLTPSGSTHLVLY